MPGAVRANITHMHRKSSKFLTYQANKESGIKWFLPKYKRSQFTSQSVTANFRGNIKLNKARSREKNLLRSSFTWGLGTKNDDYIWCLSQKVN